MAMAVYSDCVLQQLSTVLFSLPVLPVAQGQLIYMFLYTISLLAAAAACNHLRR
jgi:hypothetical protein